MAKKKELSITLTELESILVKLPMSNPQEIMNAVKTHLNVITIPIGKVSEEQAKQSLSELISDYKDEVVFDETNGELTINGVEQKIDEVIIEKPIKTKEEKQKTETNSDLYETSGLKNTLELTENEEIIESPKIVSETKTTVETVENEDFWN